MQWAGKFDHPFYDISTKKDKMKLILYSSEERKFELIKKYTPFHVHISVHFSPYRYIVRFEFEFPFPVYQIDVQNRNRYSANIEFNCK